MKKVILFVVTCLFFRTASCQVWFINFESPDSLISIDTTSGNIWQMGSPHKNLFDAPFEGTNAMVTDTINSYPPNNNSSFLLKLPYITGDSQGIQFEFSYKLDSDTLRDGGSIEYSLDGGLSWINFHYADILGGVDSYHEDTLYDGTFGISGRKVSTWHFFLGGTCSSSYPDSILFRFIFKSDSIDTQKEGWLIDNLIASALICEGIQEVNTNYHFSSVFPNPVTNISLLQIQNQNSWIRRVDFYDALGRNISTLIHPYQSNIPITKEKFGEGIFFYRVELSNNKNDSGLFVVQ